MKSAAVSAEILVIDSSFVTRLLKAPGNNFENVLTTCFESLMSTELSSVNNTAAFLSRILPHFCQSESPHQIDSLLLNERTIGSLATSPGHAIVGTSLDLLVTFRDAESIAENIDVNYAIFDLLALCIFSLLVYHNNSTLLHFLLITAEAHLEDIGTVLFNYVHGGGRRESIISILTVLMLHQSLILVPAQKEFVRAGGNLSTQLCQIAGDNTDVGCMLCSLAMRDDDAQPSLASQNSSVVRIALAKAMMSAEITGYSPEAIAGAYQLTQSPLARVILGRLKAVDQQIETLCPPIRDYVFTMPHDSKFITHWLEQTVAKQYLYTKSFLFTGTGLQQIPPTFTELDSLVSESV
jgi:hypothetical protein